MEKFCRYCVKDLPIDSFEDGRRLVKNVWNTKEGTMTMNETQRTKYIKKMNNTEKKQEQIQDYRDKVAFCNVCNSSMKVQCYSRHLKTNKHKRNLGIVDG